MQQVLKGRKRLTSLFLSFLMILALFPMTAKAATAISVAEAIANNSGTATVEGYIVAHMAGTGSADQDGNYANDYNFALADSPDETDVTKMLPVQITADYRAQFGLQTNPSNVGKKVSVTGNLEAYFLQPGLKSPTAIAFVEDWPAGVLKVSEARSLQDNSVQTVRGYIVGTVVSADNVTTTGPFSGTNLAIAETPDETDPAKMLYVQLPASQVRTDWNLLSNPDKLGSLVDVTGNLTAYFTRPGLKNTSSIVLVAGSGPVEPDPVVTAPVTFEFYDDYGNVIHEPVVKELEVGKEVIPGDHVLDIPDFKFYYGTAGLTVPEQGATIKMVYKSTKLYVVDEATGTILRFNGDFPYSGENYLDIPAEIDDVAIKHIAKSAFYAKSIRYLTIPEGVETIGDLAFASNNLFSVSFPSTLREMGKNAFSGQYLKGDIDLSKTQLTRIEEGTFSGTAGSDVGAIKLPETITYIGKSAFSNTEAKTVNLPDSITTIEAYAFAQNQLTEVSLPAELTTLGEGAFSSNDISKITFNENLSVIGPKAFSSNSLTEVRLPETIKEVGFQAFAGNPISYFEYWSGTTIGDEQFRWNNNTVEMVEMTHVIHRHVDQAGNVLAEEDIPQPVGTVINPADHVKTFEGMELVEAPESHTVVSGANTITYVYGPKAAKTGTVIFRHVDEEGNELDTEGLTFEVGTEIDPAMHVMTLEGYELVTMPEAITVAEGEQTLTYTYKKIVKNGNVIFNYVDEAGNVLATETNTFEVGTEINPADYVKTIDGYELVTMPEAITVAEGEQTLTYTYKKIVKNGNVIFNYVDEAGNVLATETKTFEVGTEINPADYVKTIDGYELVTMPEAITVAEGEQTLTYTYKMIVKKGNVNFNYVDEAGNVLATETKTFEVGTEINPADYVKTIDGYELITMPEAITVAEGEQTLTYTYKKNESADCTELTIRFVDKAGNQLAEPMVLCEKPGTKVHLKKLVSNWIGCYKLSTKANWHTFGDADEELTLVYEFSNKCK